MKTYKYLLILFLFLSSPAWAVTYYMDATLGADGNSGTAYDAAWQTGSKIDGMSFSAGDKILFKCGETFTISNDIDIPAGGSTGSPILFAAWYGAGVEGVSGNKPIITWPGVVAPGNGIFAIANNQDYINFQNLNIVGAGTTTAVDQGIQTPYPGPSNVDHIHIDACDFYGLRHYAVAFFRSTGYISVTNSTFDMCGNGVYFINESDTSTSNYNLIANNTFTNILTSLGYDAHAVGIQSTTNTIIRDNAISTTKDAIVYWGTYNQAGTLIISDNTIGSATARAIIIASTVDDENVPDTIIMRNTISGREEAFKYNYIPNDNHYLMHNTVYNSETGINIWRGASNINAFNNIFHTMSAYHVYRQDDGGSYGTPSGLDFDYNDYYDASPAWYWTSAVNTIADWRTASSLDANSIVTDPGLVNPAGGDFRITTNSNAKDAGTTLTTITTADGSGTSFVVADAGFFHDGDLGGAGIVDIDGAAEVGQDITLYDATNGYQNRTITDVNYGTATITISASADWLQNTTTVSLSYGGTAPDIGYFEYDDPQSEPVVSVIATDATAQEQGTTTGTWTIYCNPDCAGETINFTYTGNAVLNTDYDTANGEDVEDGDITITGASDTITLTPVDDAVQDINEVAILTITSGTGYTVGSPSSANITIEDNDGAQDAGVGGVGGIGSGTGKFTFTSDGSGSGSYAR